MRWDGVDTAGAVSVAPAPPRMEPAAAVPADLPGLWLRRHGRALLVLAGLTLCGGVSGWLAAPAGAVAKAVLAVTSLPADLVQAEIERLRSAEVMETIVTDIGAERLLQCAPLRAPLALIPAACMADGPVLLRAAALAQAALQLRQPDERSLVISIQHPDPQVAAAMLQSVISADATLRRQYAEARPAPVMRADPEGLRQQIGALDRQIAQLRAASPGLDPAQDLALLVAQENGLDSLAFDLGQRQQTLQAEIASAREMLRTTPPQLTETDTQARIDPAPEAARQELLRLQLERSHLQATYSASYPGLAELDRKIALAEQAMRQLPQTRASQLHASPNPVYQKLAGTIATLAPRAEGVAAQLQEVRHQRASLTTREQGLRETITTLDRLSAERGVQTAALDRLSRVDSTAQLASYQAGQSVAGLHFVPQTMALPWPAATRPALSGLGALAGLGAGLTAMRLRRRTTTLDDELGRIGRVPALERLTTITLPCRDMALPDDLLERLLRGQHRLASGTTSPPLSVHLIGTQARDGAAELSQMLAPAMAKSLDTGVLVAEFGRPGREFLQTLRLPGADEPAGGLVQAVQPVVSTGELIAGLMGAPQHQDLAMMLQLRRLREDHGVLIMVSNSEDGSNIALSPHLQADVTVLVLHAQTPPSPGLARLRATLERMGQRPSFYVATQDRALA